MHDQVFQSIYYANASKTLGYTKRNILTKHSGIREAAYKSTYSTGVR